MFETTTFEQEKWVRIMCDFCSEGVWNDDGCGDRADLLPVERPIIDRILKWQAWYDKMEGKPNFDMAAFSAEGLSIAKAVKTALLHFTVIYFDRAKLAMVDISSPRSFYEYQVFLD